MVTNLSFQLEILFDVENPVIVCIFLETVNRRSVLDSLSESVFILALLVPIEMTFLPLLPPKK